MRHQVEAHNFEIRKSVLKYDDVVTGQHELIYEERRHAFEGGDLEPQMGSLTESPTVDIVNERTVGLAPREWDLDALWDTLCGYYPPPISYGEVETEHGRHVSLIREDLVSGFVGNTQAVYEDAEDALNENPPAREQLGDKPICAFER